MVNETLIFMVNRKLTASGISRNTLRDKGFDPGRRSHYIAHHDYS
jgi:hypothetical protein